MNIKTFCTLTKYTQVILLQVTIIYFLATFHFALKENLPIWSMYGNFQMFTFRSYSHTEVRAEITNNADEGGAAKSVNLQNLFPSKWESGPRYQRASFLASSHKLRILAKSICIRSKVNNSTVRIFRDDWPVKIGEHYSNAKHKVTKLIMQFNCNNKIKLANGKII